MAVPLRLSCRSTCNVLNFCHRQTPQLGCALGAPQKEASQNSGPLKCSGSGNGFTYQAKEGGSTVLDERADISAGHLMGAIGRVQSAACFGPNQTQGGGRRNSATNSGDTTRLDVHTCFWCVGEPRKMVVQPPKTGCQESTRSAGPRAHDPHVSWACVRIGDLKHGDLKMLVSQKGKRPPSERGRGVTFPQTQWCCICIYRICSSK